MKKIIVSTLLVLLMATVAQAQYTSSGRIEFTRMVNMHLTMKLEYADQFDGGRFSMDDMLKMIPKNVTKLYLMTFNKNSSVYRYDKDGPEKMPRFGGSDPASENIVVKDFEKNTYTAQKEIFDNLFMVQDSLPQFQWKIEDELRQIAGYTCRKATTMINDSVVVVAFYTDQIMLSSGPESFGGLPGMILGLAVPRLYSTWFATKVEIDTYDPKVEKAMTEKKAKKVTIKGLQEALESSLSDWGKFGTQMLYRANI